MFCRFWQFLDFLLWVITNVLAIDSDFEIFTVSNTFKYLESLIFVCRCRICFAIFGNFWPFLVIFGHFWLKVQMSCLLFGKSNFRLQSGKYKKSYSSSRRTLAQARKRVMEKNEKKRPETMLMTPIKQLKPNSFTHFKSLL